MNLSEQAKKREKLVKRKKVIRKKIFGTFDRPRVSVYKSLKHIYVQLVNDEEGKTLLSSSTLQLKDQVKGKTKTEQAKIVGKDLALKAIEKGIKKVCFDRNGKHYIGRIKNLADAMRSAGMEF